MLCNQCGRKLQRLFTSVYCPYCEENKTNEPYDLRKWECMGQVTKIDRYQDGYMFTCMKDGTYILTYTYSMYVKYDDIISSDTHTYIEWFVDKVQMGGTLGEWCLYYREVDKMYTFTCYPHTLAEV